MKTLTEKLTRKDGLLNSISVKNSKPIYVLPDEDKRLEKKVSWCFDGFMDLDGRLEDYGYGF